MKKRLSLYVRAFFAMWHLLIVKLISPKGFSAKIPQDISCGTKISVCGGGRIFLEKHIHTRRAVTLEADGGTIRIGEGSFLNNGCAVVAKESITIGRSTAIGPNTLIYDHDHRIDELTPIHDSGFVTAPVIIGDNVWIGANTVILRGSVIGSGCVIGAGSVIKGEYPPDTVVIQKREQTLAEKAGKREEVYTA